MENSQRTDPAHSNAAQQAVTPTGTARTLHTFLYFFIVAVECELLGGEFGKEACHDTLTREQVRSLTQALSRAETVVQQFDDEVASISHLFTKLTQQVDELSRDESLDRPALLALCHGLTRAIEVATRMAAQQNQPHTNADTTGQCRPAVNANLALKVLKTCYVGYLTGLLFLVERLTDDVGRLDRDAVSDVFVCTDTGMGIVSALRSYLLESDMSADEFVCALQDQLRRSTVQEAGRGAQMLLSNVVGDTLASLG